MVKHSAKVFGYVDMSKKERIARLREQNGRLTESRLVDEGLDCILERYESQMYPFEPVRHPSKSRDS